MMACGIMFHTCGKCPSMGNIHINEKVKREEEVRKFLLKIMFIWKMGK